MKISVEMSITERGIASEKRGYMRDSEMELTDLLEWTKTNLIVIADQVLREEQAKGFDKEPIMAVDGRVGKPIEKVSPLGQIEFTARLEIKELLLETYNSILFRSKVLTGRYKSSHFVFWNGKQVATDLNSLQAWLNSNPEIEDKDVIRVVNIQPYARKLERYGITAQRSKSRYEGGPGTKAGGRQVLVPNGTYFLTARAIRSKYKRNSSIRFTFLPGSSLGLTGSFKGGRKGKNSTGRPYLYPTIVIDVSERGIL